MSTDDGPRDETVLVTGGAGFIGSNLTRSLVEANEVFVFDDGSTGDPSDLPADATVIEGDEREGDAVADAVAGVDLVYHLAAVVSVDASVEDPIRSHAVNVDGTLAVLEAARDADCRVVVTSSAAIYGDPGSVPVDEATRPDPSSPYALEKYAADRYARLYHELYGVDAAVVRPFNVYGPGQAGGPYAGVIDVFRSQARAGDPITVHGDGEQTRDFVHVSDVVDAFRRVGAAAVAGDAFNVGTGESVTINELAEVVRSAVGSDSPITHTDPRPGDVRFSRADVSKARERLGYSPSVGLEEGIEDLLRRD